MDCPRFKRWRYRNLLWEKTKTGTSWVMLTNLKRKRHRWGWWAFLLDICYNLSQWICGTIKIFLICGLYCIFVLVCWLQLFLIYLILNQLRRFIVVALAIAWEIFERISGIKESYLNSLSDILIAIVAFIVVFYLMKYFQNYSYLAHVLVVFCILVYAIFFIFKKIG